VLKPVVVILASLRGIRPAWVPSDLLAGMMLAAIAIPEQIATARLAGMPAQTGLYAFAAGTLAFALFGVNRYLSVGADSTIAPIFAGGIAAIALSSATPYPALVAVAAVLTGVGLVLAGALRAGWIADLLSIPVTVGFLAGIAVHIIIGQLPAVLGVPDGAGPLVLRFVSVLQNAAHHYNAAALLIGVGVLVVSLMGERLGPRIPGALLGLVAAGIAVAVLRLDQHGVAVLGALPTALPRVSIPLVGLRDAVQLLPVALIIALVCMVQTAVVLRAYPMQPDLPEDPSRDFTAVGIGSIAAGLFGAFAVDASPPRTAVAASSGARSQLAGMFAVIAVGGVALFGARLATYLPLAALGGVLIFVAIRILRVDEIVRIARLGGYEIWLVAAGAALVVALPIETGMALAIVLSLAHGIYIVARPPSIELLRSPGTTIWWPADEASGERIRGVLVFAPGAPITFTNVEYIVGRLRTLIAATTQPVRLLIIEAEGVIDIDYTGARILSAAIAELRARGIIVALARLSGDRAQRAAERLGIVAELGPDRTFKSVYDALESLGADAGVTYPPSTQ
jgi:MFS superfamily sulfate permease-like transporter